MLIAGNKTTEKAGEIGIEDVIIVQTDGKSLVAVQRMDIDINSPMGAKMKILDNTVSDKNYVQDAEVAEAVCQEYNLDGEALGLDELDEDGKPKAIRKIEIEPYEKTHILLSFPPEKLVFIQSLIEQIAKIDGVEIEQSSN